MSATEQENNPYELLGIKQDVTEQEIKTAYRQRSLKVHPDRNPNNPDAARKFHELNQAYELLLDPLRRMALDAKLRIKQARAERFGAADAKRKNLLEELEERERVFKKARMDKQKEEANMQKNNERIQEEGRRMREDREKELKMKMKVEMDAKQSEALSDVDPPEMDPLDTTVRIKYPIKSYPTLNTAQGIAAFLAHFGPTDESSIVLSVNLKGKKDKPPKTGSALVPFKRIGDAFTAVCASERKDLGMDSVKISWVKGDEPAILGWLKRMGKLNDASIPRKDSQSTPTPEFKSSSGGMTTELPQKQPASASNPFSSFPSSFPDDTPIVSQPRTPGIDYESLTLMRLRQAEKARLEREILEREAKES